MSEEKASKKTEIASRMFSTVCLWSVTFAAFWFANKVIFCGLMLAVVVPGLIEYFGLFHDKGFLRYRWQTILVSILYILLLFAPLWGLHFPLHGQLDALMLGLLLLLLVVSRLPFPLEGRATFFEIAAALYGFIYIVVLAGFAAKMLLLPLVDRQGNNSAHFYVLFFIAVAKLTDTGAYLVGSLIGKNKMIPHISPAKTWQGFGGAILFALLASFGCWFLMGEKIPLITPVHAVVLAVLLALVAVVGDLAESIIKRSLEAKDSGHVMPGIGGILDLIDSILLTAPVFYFYLLFLIR